MTGLIGLGLFTSACLERRTTIDPETDSASSDRTARSAPPKKDPAPDPTPVPDPVTPTVTFENLSDEILKPRCLGFHSGWKTAEALSDVVKAGEPENSPLYLLTKGGQMPPRGMPLTADQLTLIESYIKQLPVMPSEPTPPVRFIFNF